MSLDISRRSRRLPTLIGSLIVLAAAVPRACAQDSVRPQPKTDDRAERLAEMKQIAGTFRAAATDDDGKRAPAPMAREPLYRWTDPTRENNDGALWFWRRSGRPIAVLAIELYPHDPAFGTVWAMEFTSLSTGPIEVEGGEGFSRYYPDMAQPRPDGTLRWAPPKGVEFREIPDAPAPAAGEAERLRQMRDLAKRFSAREFYDITSQDYTLRLVSHPIDRYADAASGLVDGAIFTFANGTNPEVLLLIEARRRGDGAPSWSYSAAPLSRAQSTLRLGKQDVWSHPVKDVTLPGDPYFLARKPRAPSARD